MFGRLAEFLIFGIAPLMLAMIAAPAAGAADDAALSSMWQLEEIEGEAAASDVKSTFSIAGGKVSGEGGCNHYSGDAEVKDGTISFGQISSTFMACGPEAMDQETKFFAALTRVASYRVEGRTLILDDADGKELMRFVAG